MIAALLLALLARDDALALGPLLGDLRPDGVRVWARARAPGSFRLVVRDAAGATVFDAAAEARPEHELTLRWDVEHLTPDTPWTYVVSPGAPRPDDAPRTFRTPPLPETSARVVVAFGSCCDDRKFPEQPVWTAMDDLGAEAVVLLGDTPYIDTTDLAVQRERYAAFYAYPPLRALMGRVPFYCTWDDHDFGRNDTDGELRGKQEARQAFIEYHAQPSVGAHDAGIYTTFRHGPLQVFLLDTRWFAGTEPSFADPAQPTLLGQAQWEWLQEELLASDAPFKVLACGMIWNGAVRPFKRDHWGAYGHEREALFRWLGEHDVEGVLLVGGDIHRSRLVRHDTAESVGYALHEVITSPLANTVIVAANAPHPGLEKDLGIEQTFVTVIADTTARPATLTARFHDHTGAVLHTLVRTAAELREPR